MHWLLKPLIKPILMWALEKLASTVIEKIKEDSKKDK